MSLKADFRKSFGDFSLEAAFETSGGTLGILGASGCGKSMTLKCIAGIETPDEGFIEIDGKTVFDSSKGIDIKPRHRRVGYLFQDYALFPHMTVEQNIRCAMKKEDNNMDIEALLTKYHLSGLGGRYPHQLSGGQQQRAALARMLANSPSTLLLDEPFSALDAHLKEIMMVEISKLFKDFGGDVLMVTHNRDEIYTLCQNLIVIDKGRKVIQGNAKTIFNSPGFVQAAVVTGCKNISPVKHLGKGRVLAESWGIELEIPKQADNSVTHIGIRAHDFYPAAENETNAISVQFPNLVEGTFEWNLIFKASPEKDEIWWKWPKQQTGPKLPEYLAVNPENILLLQ